MRKLFLDGRVYNALYDPPNREGCTAYAHIYYGTKKSPKDQHGKSISSCHIDDGISLEKHLYQYVLPLLNVSRNESGYFALTVMRTNMNPYPFFVLARNDKQKLTPEDLFTLEDCLLKIIDKNNTNDSKNAKILSSGIFADKTPTPPAPAKEAITENRRYDFRPR
jgi:hypothetical protein